MNDKLLSTVGLAVRAGKTRFGAYLTEKAVAAGEAKLVLAAEDLGKDNSKRIRAKCAQAGVPLIFWGRKDDIGRAVGKKDVAELCVCDVGLAAAVLKIAKSMPRKEGMPNE